MKNIRPVLIILIISAFLTSAFIQVSSDKVSGSIKGSVNPADAGVRAWAVSNKDTFRTIVADGIFVIADVKPGLYTLVVEARPPYKNGGVPEVTVVEGQIADVGEIKLIN